MRIQIEIRQAAIEHYSDKNQCDIALEKMAELTKAMLKNSRYNTTETEFNIIEEIAGLIRMIQQIKII